MKDFHRSPGPVTRNLRRRTLSQDTWVAQFCRSIVPVSDQKVVDIERKTEEPLKVWETPTEKIKREKKERRKEMKYFDWLGPSRNECWRF